MSVWKCQCARRGYWHQHTHYPTCVVQYIHSWLHLFWGIMCENVAHFQWSVSCAHSHIVQKRKATKSICSRQFASIYRYIDLIVFNHLNGCHCRYCRRCLCDLAFVWIAWLLICCFSKFFFVSVTGICDSDKELKNIKLPQKKRTSDTCGLRDERPKEPFLLLVICKDLLCFFFRLFSQMFRSKKWNKKMRSHVTDYNRV